MELGLPNNSSLIVRRSHGPPGTQGVGSIPSGDARAQVGSRPIDSLTASRELARFNVRESFIFDFDESVINIVHSEKTEAIFEFIVDLQKLKRLLPCDDYTNRPEFKSVTEEAFVLLDDAFVQIELNYQSSLSLCKIYNDFVNSGSKGLDSKRAPFLKDLIDDFSSNYVEKVTLNVKTLVDLLNNSPIFKDKFNDVLVFAQTFNGKHG